jgi:hypothetical protein
LGVELLAKPAPVSSPSNWKVLPTQPFLGGVLLSVLSPEKRPETSEEFF